ncbi:sporulation protein YqfD [Aceticella autotrophica]|uniref:Sporulation protein YqfD n=1 Tax=Aceticella autotrophica TaxID=2755338 RepID=A0A975AUS2_9THEO|nr:sporulation protein YqfD [Aceticella autotrophica]QSZ26822.1 sporulation protein YqfD [Aceticella autotrophica]
MLAIKLWNFLRGYAIIKIEGLSLEKLLNLIISRDIYIWDIKRTGHNTVIAKISLKGFKLLQPHIRITNCKVSIIGKKGLPFIILYFKRRKMLIFGAVLCMVLICIFSSFIWCISIEGIKNTNEQAVIEELKKLGLKEGVFKYSVDIPKIESEFLVDMKNVAWIGIDIKGTKAFIKIVEKTKPPEILPSNVACNIIAKRDGIIYKMVILQGDAVKKVGDTVKAGDIIVSGVIERPYAKTRFVHSNAEIIARTWYEGYADVDLSKQAFKRTGKSISITNISLGENTITFALRKMDFKHYDKETKIITSKNSPVKIIKETYYETEIEHIKLNKDEAEKLAIEKALKNIKSGLENDVKIISEKKKTMMIENHIIRANVIVEALENIGMEEKIDYKQEVQIE